MSEYENKAELLDEEKKILKEEMSQQEFEISNCKNENHQVNLQNQTKNADIDKLKIELESFKVEKEHQISTFRHSLDNSNKCHNIADQENRELKLNFQKMDQEYND